MKKSDDNDPRVQIRDDVDPESEDYKKRVVRVMTIVLILSLIGGLWLGWKIQRREADDSRNVPAEQQKQQGESSNGAESTPE